MAQPGIAQGKLSPLIIHPGLVFAGLVFTRSRSDCNSRLGPSRPARTGSRSANSVGPPAHHRVARQCAARIARWEPPFGPDGTRLWEWRPAVEGFARFFAAAVDSQGSLYVGGWVSGAAPGQTQIGGTDAFVTKIDGDGRSVWTHQFGTDLEDRTLGITVDQAGNSYAVGWTRGEFPDQDDSDGLRTFERQDAFIHKIGPQGDGLWTRQIGTPSPQAAAAVVIDGAGSLYIVGNTTGPILGQRAVGTVDAFLIKLDGGPPGDPLEALPPAPSTASAAPDPGMPATATPSGTVSTVLPTPLDPARSPPSTPVTAPTVTPIDRAPSTSACSAPKLGGGPIQMGWLLVTMIPASLAMAGWRRRRRM